MTPKEFITACDDAALKTLLSDLANRGFGLSTLETVKENLNKTSYDAFAKLLSKSLNLDFFRKIRSCIVTMDLIVFGSPKGIS